VRTSTALHGNFDVKNEMRNKHLFRSAVAGGVMKGSYGLMADTSWQPRKPWANSTRRSAPNANPGELLPVLMPLSHQRYKSPIKSNFLQRFGGARFTIILVPPHTGVPANWLPA